MRGCRLHLFNRVEMENSFRERQRRKEIEKKTQKGERPCFWKHLMKKILYFVTAAVVVAVVVVVVAVVEDVVIVDAAELFQT